MSPLTSASSRVLPCSSSADVNGVRVAEQVMEVAEDFLVRAHEEDAQVVVVGPERMQGKRLLHVAAIDEAIELAVRIAGDVAEDGVVQRLLVQPVNGHHREQLLDRPAVGDRLEQREVAEIGVGQLLVQVLQILRHLGHRQHNLLQLRADRPEQVFRHASLIERQVAAVEEAERHVERLLGVVERLERVPAVTLL